MNNAITKAVEALKFHPDASHVEPKVRDTWNRALDRALKTIDTLVLGKPVAWYRAPSKLEPYGDEAEGEAVYGPENPNMPGLDEGWQPAYGAMASLIEVPVKLDIPPAPADALDVAYAEGWNAACEAYFQGKPAPEALVITVNETKVEATEVKPICWANPDTLKWVGRQSEMVLKVTQQQQARYGFTRPLFDVQKAVSTDTAKNEFPVTFEQVAQGIEVGYDMFGGVDIRLGGDFVYVHINYDYRYTSNQARQTLAEKIVQVLKGESELPKSSEVRKAADFLVLYWPCGHENADTSLGDGKTWAKCEECDQVFKQEDWQRTRETSAKFGEAISLIYHLAASGGESRAVKRVLPIGIPRGFEVKHNPNDPGASQAWNDANRFTVRRLEAPYATEAGKKYWSAPTLEEALSAACTALGVSNQAGGKVKDAE